MAATLWPDTATRVRNAQPPVRNAAPLQAAARSTYPSRPTAARRVMDAGGRAPRTRSLGDVRRGRPAARRRTTRRGDASPTASGRLPACLPSGQRRGAARRSARHRRHRDPRGCVEFADVTAGSAEDVHELVVGLGYRARRRRAGRRDRDQLHVFCTRRRRVPARAQAARPQGAARGSCASDRPPRTSSTSDGVVSVPVRCVEVDNADHLYLAGRAMIPTHNSTLGLDVARSAAIKNNMATCIFSLEMSRNEITMRLLSAEARVPLHHMRTGKLTDDDWTRLARRMGEVVQRAAVHRRLTEHVDDGDPGQVPAPQAAARPQARRSSTTCS